MMIHLTHFFSEHVPEMNIIFQIHLAMFITLMLLPFTNDQRTLEFYSIMIPFLFLHWTTNDDTCALTVAEQWVTGKEKQETFFGRVMGGIYHMPDDDASKFFKGLMFFLWLFVQYRLGRLDIFVDDLKTTFELMTPR